MARGVEIIPGSVDLLPSHSHFAGCLIHIIFVGAVTLPSGDHASVRMEIIVPAVQLEPSGHHLAIPVEVVPVIVDDCPARSHISIGIEVIRHIVDGLPSGDHSAVGLHIIVFSVQVQPAAHQPPIAGKVIERAVHFPPSGDHGSVALQIIVVGADPEPSGNHGPVQKIIPFPIILEPFAGHPSVCLQIVPLTVNGLPPGHHLSGFRKQIIIGIIQQQPSLILGAVRIHIVPALSVVDPAGLLYIILIIIPFPVDQPPSVSRKLGRQILEDKVDIHISVDAVDLALVGGLPHSCARVGWFCVIPGHPHIIRNLGHIDLLGKPVIIGVDHGVVSGGLHLLTECVDHIRQLGRSQSAHFCGFHIQHHRIRNWIVLDQIQNKICLRLRCGRCGGVRINISAYLQSRIEGVYCVDAEIWVHLVVIFGSQHNELHIVRRHGVPVDGLLPVGNINAPGCDPCERRAVRRHIGAVGIPFPGRRKRRDGGIYGCKRHGQT